MDQRAVDTRTRVFVSYSRKDAEFLSWLAQGLRDRGLLVDYDRSTEDPNSVTTGISAEDAWWTRLEEMITAAEVIVFVVSPDSARSRVCDEEIAFAQGLGKRIIPVLWRPIDFDTAPPRLSTLNIKISFATPDSDRLTASLQELVTSIHTDVRWFRTAALLSAAARRWDASGRPADRLLRGVELREAEAWAARRPSSAPRHPDILLEFLAESRGAEDERATLAAIEQARYHELIEILRPFLEAEIKLRERLPESNHWGVAKEMQQELMLLQSILYTHHRWHPEEAVFVSHTGAAEGYAEIFRFPCCGKISWEYRSAGPSEPPSQLRADGCKDLPEAARREGRERMNPFTSQLVARYWRTVNPERNASEDTDD
ncbi:toll/interleukin-1 receptor domain-containing protein [Streptomyces capitiformicae]|nr:toll/interleukin-1 receptor domain-containing protein [Streptomyces capitiformicae]